MRRISSWIGKIWQTETWVLQVFLVAALLLAFCLVAYEVIEGATLRFDRDVMFLFRNGSDNFSKPIGPAWVQEMARDVTSLGSFSVLIILLTAVIGYLLLARKRESAWLLLVAVLGGVAISSLLKFSVARPRPDLFDPAARVFTASFPSDHASLSAISYLTLAALLAATTVSRKIRVYFIVVALTLTFLIGLSRIYLGVHYPTDILAGWCIGSAWALGCWTVITRFQSRAGRLPSLQR